MALMVLPRSPLGQSITLSGLLVRHQCALLLPWLYTRVQPPPVPDQLDLDLASLSGDFPHHNRLTQLRGPVKNSIFGGQIVQIAKSFRTLN